MDDDAHRVAVAANTIAKEPVEPLRYSVELFDAFAAVCDKAKLGVQSCQAIAAFVQERANIEASYARAVTKIATNAKVDDWAPGFANCWHLVQATLAGLAKLHTESAAKMQTTIVAGARAFAAQQEIQVQRLIAEGTKSRTVQQNMYLSLERAKEKYDKRCAEASELAATMKRSSDLETQGSSPTGSAQQLPAAATSASPAASDQANEESVGQLLTKMWDSTSAFAKPSVERQRSKLESSLDEVIAAEKFYVQMVEYVNTQRLILEREVAENLHAFQLTEEQRIEYLKDVLYRLQKLLLSNLESSRELLNTLRDGTNDVNEFGDIEDGFRKLSNGIDPEAQVLDPNDNAFYQRMCQVQAMSERGHHVVRVIHSTLADFVSIEDHFVSSTQRLLRAHEASNPTTSDLFNLSPALSHVSGEGPSMQVGWNAMKEQTQRVGDVHLELRSLLAEPVLLNITTMKHEYEASRTGTHESFAKTHGALCHDAAAHQKLKQKLDARLKEFAQCFSSLPDMGEIDLRNLDVAQALVLVHQLSSTFSDKERRIEAKMKTIAEEVRDLQQKVAESLSNLKTRCSSYIQDVDVFISVYMKNEKFRLQVEKSSILSLTKALEHAVEGATVCVKAALDAIGDVDGNVDVSDFIRTHRVARERLAKVSVIHTNDAALSTMIDEHRRAKASAVATATQDAKMTPKSNDRKLQATQLKRTNSHPSAPTSGPSVERTLKTSATAVIDDDRDQPMAMSEFQKKFKLDEPEQVVESYSCALYANNFPNHGRMYLTSNRICFAGWRDTIYVVAYTDITMMEKKNSAIIVPNAIEITANGEKAFFTSFVFRDECLQCIIQLQGIKKATLVAMSEPGRETKPTVDVVASASTVAEDVPSPTSQIQIAPVSITTDNTSQPEHGLKPVQEAVVPTVPQQERRIPDRDPVLDDFEVVIDEEIPLSVDFAYERLWIGSNAFLQRLLEAGGDTSIRISPWEHNPVTYTAVNISDTFHGSRKVAYVHNKKYMVGPSTIPTDQVHRYKWDPHTQLVISVTTIVSDVPYCDYFRAENRWVFSNTTDPSCCKVQVGVRIHWLKSTWLKKQIESTAMGEAKESTRVLVNAAIRESKTSAPSKLENVATPQALPHERTSDPAPTQIETVDADTESTSGLKDTHDHSAPAKPIHSTTQDTQHGSPISSVVSPSKSGDLKSILQVLQIVCLVVFVLTMYRIGNALDQMQAITRESLVQQQEQSKLLQSLLLQLQAQP